MVDIDTRVRYYHYGDIVVRSWWVDNLEYRQVVEQSLVPSHATILSWGEFLDQVYPELAPHRSKENGQ